MEKEFPSVSLEMKGPPVWYKITNLETGTVIDIHGPIHAWSNANVKSQEWKLEQLNPSYYYAIKNRTGDIYLCVEDPLNFNGARLVASESQKGEWQFQLDEKNKACFRIWAAGTTFAIDIENGIGADGARILLWDNDKKSESQMWKLVRA